MIGRKLGSPRRRAAQQERSRGLDLLGKRGKNVTREGALVGRWLAIRMHEHHHDREKRLLERVLKIRRTGAADFGREGMPLAQDCLARYLRCSARGRSVVKMVG
jgi:hypothetical protein